MTQQDVLDYIRKTPHNSNVNVVKGMLDSLGGSSLPEVTNEDNGKVLTVVEGEWNKANASGGGAEPLIVHSIDSSTRATLDKTFGEIKAAFESGRTVLVDRADEYTPYYMDSVMSIYIDSVSSQYSGLIIIGERTYGTGGYDTEAEVYDAYPFYSLD